MAWTMTYSALDSSAGLPDKIYTLGPYDNEVTSLREELYFSQEIIGVYLLGNASPDYEGIFFLLEDYSIHRIGLD